MDMDFDAAAYPLALCPNWLMRLRWLHWWRDAGPVDIDAETLWGEGCYLVLTPVGLEQITTALGKPALDINVFASRQIKQSSNHGKSLMKTATNGYSL
jgi:hypothetical protein